MSNEVVSSSKEKVAFDLMYLIGQKCSNNDQAAQGTKDYWLKLYRQCWKATNGNKTEYVLTED